MDVTLYRTIKATFKWTAAVNTVNKWTRLLSRKKNQAPMVPCRHMTCGILPII